MSDGKKKFYFETRKSLQAISLLSIFTMIIMFQNCSVISPGRDDGSLSASSKSDDAALLERKAMSILSGRCVSCHNPQIAEGGIENITDINYLLYYRLVIPGQPEISDLISVIKEGTMPPGQPLRNDELEALNQWILSGLVDESGGVGLPGGGGVLEARYSSIQTRIFNIRCVSCHSGANPPDGINLTAYAGARAVVTPGNAANSRLMLALRRPGADFMPRNGTRLSAEELTRMDEWINGGALDN